jgi:hypothetical protein
MSILSPIPKTRAEQIHHPVAIIHSPPRRKQLRTQTSVCKVMVALLFDDKEFKFCDVYMFGHWESIKMTSIEVRREVYQAVPCWFLPVDY